MKKSVKRIMTLAVFILLLYLINCIMTYILVDDAQDQFRYSMHEFYNQENIDVLFLGSSHVFCGVDPSVLEEKWDKDVYLAATSIQKPDGSYYLLNEAVKQYDLETVYLDMYYWQYRDDPSERGAYQMDYIHCITDYMKPSIDKLRFILDASTPEYYLESLIIPSRYTDKFMNLEYIEQVIKSKRTEAYKTYKCPQEISENYYKGFINAWGTVTPGSLNYMTGSGATEAIRDNPVSDYSMKYLKKIIALCEKNNIELILFTTPMTAFHCGMLGNYDTYSDAVMELAGEHGIQFYDFNLLKSEVNTYTDDLFCDSHHLNGNGADIFSADLAWLINENKLEDRKKYFYQNLYEKNQERQPQCDGLLLDKQDNRYHIIPVGSREQLELEYRITEAGTDTEESRLIQDYSLSSEFTTSIAGNVQITLEARQKGETENSNVVQVIINE